MKNRLVLAMTLAGSLVAVPPASARNPKVAPDLKPGNAPVNVIVRYKTTPGPGHLQRAGSLGGSNKAVFFAIIPGYQSGLGIPNPSGRGVPDVAYLANPSKGLSVYDSVPYNGSTGWFVVGGTSAGTPQWAALAAITNSMRIGKGKQPLGATQTSTLNYLLYSLAVPATYAANYHDITSGTNGTCGAICTAAAGYDYVTGLGSPKANALITALVAKP